MIKLFSLKQQKKDGVDAAGQSGSHKKSSAAQLRIQKGVNIDVNSDMVFSNSIFSFGNWWIFD